MNIDRLTYTLAASTGDITSQTSDPISGRVLSIHLQYGSATDTGFATTAAIAITAGMSGQTIWSETLTTLATTTVNIHRLPRQNAHTSTGGSLTATESLQREPFYLGNDKLTITATAVGSGTKSARLVINLG